MTDKKRNQHKITRQNVLESLKDLGGGVVTQAGDLLIGIQTPKTKKSGEIGPGESLQMQAVIEGKDEENKRLRAQIVLERNLSQDEKRLSQERIGQLRVQLQAITIEINKLAQSTGKLATETEIAMIEVPVNPGIYHVIFFEKVIEFLQSFRKKIEQASVWLEGSNKRAEKKNYWARYKKGRGSFLLAPDHYLQRSAG